MYACVRDLMPTGVVLSFGRSLLATSVTLLRKMRDGHSHQAGGLELVSLLSIFAVDSHVAAHSRASLAVSLHGRQSK